VPKSPAATYLAVPYAQRKQVSALGARFDGSVKKWFVPAGQELTPFRPWLTVPLEQGDLLSQGTELVNPADVQQSEERGVASIRGIPLSQLMASISGVLEQAFDQGVWTTVDVVDIRTNGGHVYLEVAERDARGAVLAKSRAMIWSRVANIILPEFQKATGMTLAPSMKLLMRVKPNFHAQFGFGLTVEAIDAQYTLGDLEARRREIRARLKAEGIWEANRRLAAPWDFNHVLVVSPAAAAGLGDFRAEADRLHAAGVCRFVYAESRFQGHGAASDICDAAHQALAEWAPAGTLPDVIVIIRGGGAVNDLAWLDDYCLAKFVCDAPVPVFTGIGHERDSTVIDEVAHTAFDTPSKVIAGIERNIAERAAGAKAAFQAIAELAARRAAASRTDADRLQTTVRSQALHAVATAAAGSDAKLAAIRTDALQSLAQARAAAHRLDSEVRQDAVRSLGVARLQVAESLGQLREDVQDQIARARQATPLLLVQVKSAAERQAEAAKAATTTNLQAVGERVQGVTSRARRDALLAVQQVGAAANQQVGRARDATDALMREVAGQGPAKTLKRGFAIVRNEAGDTVTDQQAGRSAGTLSIEFHDGAVAVAPVKE
jgi:exodeoxyribonuclease VII large subunit